MLVGRSASCAHIDLLLAGARARRGVAALVSGGPGVGKTALLRYAQERAGDMAVLHAQGVESETELPYAGLSQLLTPVLALSERLEDQQRRTLAAALGVGVHGPPGERFMVYLATLSLLAQAAEERPVLALVDDVHWLDAASAEALAFVAGRLENEGIVLLFGARDVSHAALRARRLTRIELEGIDVTSAGALLEEVAPVPVPPSVVEALYRQTAGVPLALLEVARLLSSRQLAGSEPLPDPLPAGPDLDQAFGARIAALPADAQWALLVAAAHDGTDVQPLARAWGARGIEVSALAEAESQSLVSISGGQLEFSHPVLRSVAYARAPAPLRRDAHAALAGALSRSGRERLRRAWHLAAAAPVPDETVATELEAVAQDAHRRAAPATAGRALEGAARLSPTAPGRAARLLAAARAYHLAGDATSAWRLLDEAQAETDDGLLRADVQHLRAQIVSLSGSPADSLALLADEAERIESLDPARAATLRLEAASASFMLGESGEGLRLAQRAFPVAEQQGGTLALVAALMLGTARVVRGEPGPGEELVARARPLMLVDELSVVGLLASQVTMGEMWLGHFEDARRMHADLVRRIRETGALTALPFALTALAMLHFYCGDLRLAAAVSIEAIDDAETLGQRPFGAFPLAVLAQTAGAMGKTIEAREHLERALALKEEFGLGSIPLLTGWARGQVELAVGAHDDAIAALEPTGRLAGTMGLEEPGVAYWAQDLAEAYIRVGRIGDSRQILDTLERQAARAGRPLALAGAARCRGLLADDQDFEDHFRRALAYHDLVLCPLERARTELCYGERLRRARRRTEARQPLQRALATVERIGAAPWAEHVRRELRATGQRTRRRVPEATSDLTPQEVQVAMQVAGGATNREAAAALFVTPKTIEAHLNRIYRKLGVRSRTELARLLHEGLDQGAGQVTQQAVSH